MRKEDLYEIVKNFVKTRKEDPYAFFTASLRMRKFKISLVGYLTYYIYFALFSSLICLVSNCAHTVGGSS